MTWQNIRTASPHNSIWRDLPETTFRRHLVALEERTNAVPIDPQVFDIKTWHSPHSANTSDTSGDDRYSLPIEVEQDIADDFACLAAVEEGAQSVAAVCVEERRRVGGLSGLTLRFAALDTSLDVGVKNALQEICGILTRMAGKTQDVGEETVSDDDDDDEISDLMTLILRLHSRRLLARLRSSKWEKPVHLRKSHKKPLHQDLANLIHRAQFLYSKKEKPARLELETAVRELESVYSSFETLDPSCQDSHDDNDNDNDDDDGGENMTPLKLLVEASFSFCTNDAVRDYNLRLLHTTTGTTPTKQLSSALKTLRQIEKIAAYKRICLSLVSRATRFAEVFAQGVELAFLGPCASVETGVAFEDWARVCHVHAEVQLVVFYDLEAQQVRAAQGVQGVRSAGENLEGENPEGQNSEGQNSEGSLLLPPRTIGISKWLCFLCYKFLAAHGGFFPSKTHGRLYDQWTLPDLEGFEEEMRERYRGIVGTLDEGVREMSEGGPPQLWRVEPMTSRQDLLMC